MIYEENGNVYKKGYIIWSGAYIGDTIDRLVKNVPIVLSTGMATLDEIETAVHEIECAGNPKICILHCVSLYPVESKDVNLKNIVMLKERFPQYAIGYSDHTIGSEVSCAAVALGAVMIEKHFTLDNKRIGWDNQMATEPEDMKLLVDRCNSVHNALGNYKRILTSEEIEQRKRMRRSLVANIDMPKGHVICEDDITAKRPGDGISVSEYKRIIGQVVKKDIQKGQLILEEHI